MQIKKRKEQLQALSAFLKDCEPEIIQALKKDLGRPSFESSVLEIGSLRSEINYAIKNLTQWARPKSVKTPLVSMPGKSWIQYEPLGKILIIAPWNYPFQLTIAPLVGAIAAGNQTVIKPSELAPHSAELLAHKLANYVETQIVLGGPETTQHLLDQRWDHIVYTGGERVARIVLEKAAKHLTPTTLELGGKCPVIVDKETPVRLTAKRIAWGKFINAGQTCIAPDYILAHCDIKNQLIAELKQCVGQFYGSNPQLSSNYGRVINRAHLERLCKLSPSSRFDLEELYFEPTILDLSTQSHALMQDEIFGPILPVLAVNHMEEAIAIINQKPKPLALYCFSDNQRHQQQVLEQTQSGGVCLNDTISHIGNPELPFGGVGNSGFGAYHGRFGFERFSHAKAIYQRSTLLDIPLRYPPYSATTSEIANWFQR